MIELANLEDLEKVEHLPQEIADDLAIFSAEYGSERSLILDFHILDFWLRMM